MWCHSKHIQSITVAAEHLPVIFCLLLYILGSGSTEFTSHNIYVNRYAIAPVIRNESSSHAMQKTQKQALLVYRKILVYMQPAISHGNTDSICFCWDEQLALFNIGTYIIS